MNKLKDLLIKILSLGIGLSVGIVLIAKICFELSYDTAFTDVERIYQIRTGHAWQDTSNEFPTTSGATAFGFRSEVPGVVEATRTTEFFDSPVFLDEEGHAIEAETALADSCFFRLFDRPALAGDPGKALAEAYTAVVSRSLAEKLGGVEACLGKLICNKEMPDLKFPVGAVFEDFPANSSLRYDLLLSMESYSRWSTQNWIGNDRYLSYVKLAEGVDPRTLDGAIRKMQEAHQPIEEIERNGQRLWYYLTPFDRMHTSDPTVRTTVLLLSVVAFLLLLISLLNYLLIVISSMVKRSREMGVRKCYGAGTADIYALLLRETSGHLLLALALAAALIFAGRSLLDSLLGVSFVRLLLPQSLAAIGAVIAGVLTVSIAVPAQLYLRVPVGAALKNYTDTSRRWKLGLLGVQVFINVFLAVMLFVISAQYRLLLNDDLGYDREGLLYCQVPGNDRELQRRFCEALRPFPEVLGIEAADDLPLNGASGDNVFDATGRHELFNASDNYEATPGFYALLGIPFVEGRAPQSPEECAVDEHFVAKMREFGYWNDSAVGQTVCITGHDQPRFTVAGVYRPILTGNRLWSDLRPGIRFYGSLQDETGYLPCLLVKVRELNPELVQRLNAALAEALDDPQAELHAYADTLRAAYDESRKMRSTLLLGALSALLIALMGLIGFIRDETLRRSKETAIRKINGAAISDILALFARDILRLSGAMAVAGCAAAAWAADRWLGQFGVRTPLAAGYFAGGALLVLSIVALVVAVSCWRIAAANPVESLKNE